MLSLILQKLKGLQETVWANLYQKFDKMNEIDQYLSRHKL